MQLSWGILFHSAPKQHDSISLLLLLRTLFVSLFCCFLDTNVKLFIELLQLQLGYDYDVCLSLLLSFVLLLLLLRLLLRLQFVCAHTIHIDIVLCTLPFGYLQLIYIFYCNLHFLQFLKSWYPQRYKKHNDVSILYLRIRYLFDEFHRIINIEQ